MCIVIAIKLGKNDMLWFSLYGKGKMNATDELKILVIHKERDLEGVKPKCTTKNAPAWRINMFSYALQDHNTSMTI